MPGRSLYFAYGSNLDPQQMKRRCPGSDAVGEAFAHGYALTFPVHSNGDWQGGVASIEAPDDVPAGEPQATLGGVWGVVYLVTPSDLASLDRYEAVAEGMYTRGEIKVKVPPSKKNQTVVTYFAKRGYNAPQPPSKKYRAAIVRGGGYHDLPEAYLDQVRAVATRD